MRGPVHLQRALLYLLIAAAYLLLAGGPRWALPPLLAIAAVAVFLTPRRTLALGARSRAFDVTSAAVVVASALPLVPLPPGLVGWMSPRAQHLRGNLTAVVPEGWLPLSVSPSATVASVGSLLLAVLAYRVARTVFDREGGSRRFCRMLTWAAAAAAVAALVQRGLAPAGAMGLVSAETAGARLFGPFLNRNHFAAWLLLTLPVTAGYLVAHVRRVFGGGHPVPLLRGAIPAATLLLVLAWTVAVAGLALTLSRSASIGFGVALMAWWFIVRRRAASSVRGWPAAVGAAGVAILAAATLVDLDGWAARMEGLVSPDERPDSRLVIWRDTLPVIGDFWATGSGAGTYGSVMLAYQLSRIWLPHLTAWAPSNQAHSHYLQLAAEGGLLVAVPTLVAVGALVQAGTRALRDDLTEIFWIRAGAAASLAGVAAQSVWEEPLTMPANAVLCAVLAALLLHEPGARSAAKGRGRASPRWRRLEVDPRDWLITGDEAATPRPSGALPSLPA